MGDEKTTPERGTRLVIAGRDGHHIAIVTVVVAGEEPWMSTHDISEVVESLVAVRLLQIKAPPSVS